MDLENLDWLEGHWRIQEGETLWEEYWGAPAGDGLTAMTRWVEGGETRLVELTFVHAAGEDVILRLRHFGVILEIPEEEWSGPMEWKLVELDGRKAVFEDPERTFPRRIVYERLQDDMLSARLEGLNEGEVSVTEFRFRRAD
jgi:hypothetical protein